MAMLLAVSAMARHQGRTLIKPSDLVSVQCDEETTLSKDYMITRDGFIIMQFVGALKVAGLTETAAAQKISSALVSERIMKKASVHVKVLSSGGTSISFAGAVKHSGQLPAKSGIHLSDVIKAAEPTGVADLERVKIITASGNQILVNYKAYDGKNVANNPELRAGDTVFFGVANYPGQSAVNNANSGGSTATSQPTTQPDTSPKPPTQPTTQPATQPTTSPVAPTSLPQTKPTQPADMTAGLQTITVLGAVQSPRTISFRNGMGVEEAIAQAGGLLKNSDVENVKVDRKIDGKTRTMKEDLGAVQRGMAGDILLRPSDVVNVPYKSSGRGITKTMKIGAAVLLGLLIFR